MIGINYVGHDPGELRGCHNDVLNMVREMSCANRQSDICFVRSNSLLVTPDSYH